ncbi:MAG: phytoene/squalene synthase family protein, partial [Sphingomonadales bacterium]
QLYDRQPIEHPIGRALAEAIKRKSLARERFDAMIDGRMRDIHDQTPETFADLLDYLSNTSAQLFRLAASALGNDDPSLDEAAKHAGLAWALVGIIRAVPFHAGQGRLYLPLDLLRDAGITPDEAVHGGGVPGLAAVVERLAQEAGTHIAAARRLAPRVSPRILPAFLPVRLARGYLKAIARSRFDPFALGPPPRPMRRLLSLAAGQLMRRF